jgi:hypothetical protein
LLGYINATLLTITNLNLSSGSFIDAALFSNIAQHDWEVGIYSSIETGAIHFIGKLTLIKSNLPFRMLFPSFFSISVPADLNFDERALSRS